MAVNCRVERAPLIIYISDVYVTCARYVKVEGVQLGNFKEFRALRLGPALGRSISYTRRRRVLSRAGLGVRGPVLLPHYAATRTRHDSLPYTILKTDRQAA